MNKTYTVFKYTLLEVIRSKLMIVIPIVSTIILFVSYLSSAFAYGAPGRVAIDIGLGLMSLANLAISIFVGATLVGKEIESKTIYMIISKPISRIEFLIGKILGLCIVLVLNVVCQTVVCTIIYQIAKGEVPSLLYYVGLFSLFESIVVMLIAIVFSLMTNVSLTVIFTFLTWGVGCVLSETQKILFSKSNAYLNELLTIASMVFPDFSKFNIKDFVLYQQTLPDEYIAKAALYFMFYSGAIFVLASTLFKNKDLS